MLGNVVYLGMGTIKDKVWVEVSIHTDEQVAVISHNETRDQIHFTLKELESGGNQFVMYLTYNEALEISKQLSAFVKNNTSPKQNG